MGNVRDTDLWFYFVEIFLSIVSLDPFHGSSFLNNFLSLRYRQGRFHLMYGFEEKR